jgi:hypothetical protein
MKWKEFETPRLQHLLASRLGREPPVEHQVGGHTEGLWSTRKQVVSTQRTEDRGQPVSEL